MAFSEYVPRYLETGRNIGQTVERGLSGIGRGLGAGFEGVGQGIAKGLYTSQDRAFKKAEAEKQRKFQAEEGKKQRELELEKQKRQLGYLGEVLGFHKEQYVGDLKYKYTQLGYDYEKHRENILAKYDITNAQLASAEKIVDRELESREHISKKELDSLWGRAVLDSTSAKERLGMSIASTEKLQRKTEQLEWDMLRRELSHDWNVKQSEIDAARENLSNKLGNDRKLKAMDVRAQVLITNKNNAAARDRLDLQGQFDRWLERRRHQYRSIEAASAAEHEMRILDKKLTHDSKENKLNRAQENSKVEILHDNAMELAELEWDRREDLSDDQLSFARWELQKRLSKEDEITYEKIKATADNIEARLRSGELVAAEEISSRERMQQRSISEEQINRLSDYGYTRGQIAGIMEVLYGGQQ